jgi:hypothetical protein
MDSRKLGRIQANNGRSTVNIENLFVLLSFGCFMTGVIVIL